MGIIWPPPLCIGSPATTASSILNFTLRIASGEHTMTVHILYHWLSLRSSHNGPSLVPHWNPCTMESRTVLSKDLSTYVK